MQSYTVAIPVGGPSVDAEVLTAVAVACRDHEQLRFDYVGHDGASSRRRVEPHRLVNRGRRWYLVAWDIDRADWRTFRADRLTPRIPTGPRFAPRDLPDDGIAEFVTRGVDSALWRFRARILLYTPAAAIAGRLPSAVSISPIDDHSCVIEAGADTFEMLAVYLAMLDVDFEVIDPPEFAEHLRRQASRYLSATVRHTYETPDT